MKLAVRSPPVAKAGAQAAARARKELRSAAILATDRASKDAQAGLQRTIRSVGLGRLAGAVGRTSTLREKQQSSGRDPYGVIFARGGDESLAGGALESYSRGAFITPSAGKQWLAFATNAVPKFVTVGGRRYRTTPELFRNSALASSIGTLEFRPLGPNRAILVLKKVTVSPKTGRAKRAGPGRTRTRIPMKEVVAFVLIRVTRRAKRFDKDSQVRLYSLRVPGYMRSLLAGLPMR